MLILAAMGMAGSNAPSKAALGTFSLDRLRLGGSTGAEDYLFTSGDVVFPDGGAASGTFYKVVVTDGSGSVRNPGFPCTPGSAFAMTDNTYTVKAADPVSTAASWRLTLQQFAASTCNGTPTKTVFKSFYVAKASAYADSALTTPRSIFAANATAYITVGGVKPGSSDWSTTWISPSVGTACANTAGGDRPESGSAGNLPKGGAAYLQYRPSTTATGSSWNREANYELRPCPSFSTANQGIWQLRLSLNATNFVVLSVFTLDSTPPPTPSIDSGFADPMNSSSASFSFSDSESGVSLLCQLDGAAFGACTSPINYTALADGRHTFQLKARDAAGNESAPVSRSWTVDTTPPPTPTIDSGPPDQSNSGSASFGFSDGEPGVSFLCQLDGGGFGACASPTSYSGLADGTHSFQLKARDALGNESAPVSRSWTVDTMPPPTPTIDSYPADPSNSSSASFSFSDSEPGVSFLCQLDGAGFGACTSPTSYSALADGTHSFQLKARDAAGNESGPVSRSWTVAAPPPTPTIDSGPADPSNSSSASFSFSDSESGVSFLCQLDGAGFGACTSPTTYSVLADGTHSFQLKARDAAGNDSAPVSRSWTVDTTPPLVALTLPGDGTTTNSSTPIFSGSAGGAPGDALTVTVRVYAGSSVAGTPVQTLSAQRQLDGSYLVGATSPLGNGTYTAQAEQADAAGNLGRSLPNSFVVAAPNPPANATPPAISGTAQVGQLLRADPGSWSGTQPLSYAYQWRRCDSGGGTCADIAGATGSSYTLVPLDAGATIRVLVTASNAAGSASASSAPTSVVIAASGCTPRSSDYSNALLATSGLVGYWRLGESSGTVACDSKGGNDGAYQLGTTLAQAGALAGDPDTAVAFNGSGRVQVPHAASLNVGDHFTIEAWVKRGAISSSANQVIAAKQSDAWVLMFNSSDQLVLRKSGVADVAASTATVTDTSAWHYVAATKDGSTVHLYLDGQEVTGSVANQTMSDNTQPLAIGQSSGTAYFNGTIDEVALYNVALSASQLSAHYTVGAGTTDPMIAAAGDIACDPASPAFNGGAGTASACRQQATANLLLGQPLSAVLPLGDDQYDCGGFNAYLQSYDLSWGLVKAISHPVPGNHEYSTSGTDCDATLNAGGYFSYFGAAAGEAGKGYYSYDIGSWHLIALNSNCFAVGGCGAGSPQETWLRADLAAHSTVCTLAYWHHPRFTSGEPEDLEVSSFWSDLYAAGADIVLNGHSHSYERFAPQDPNGNADPASGIREFVVGTGGEDLESFPRTAPNTEVRTANVFGVLKLTLHSTSYDWRFVSTPGGTFSDSGSTMCH